MAGFALWIPATAAHAADPCCSMSVTGLPGTFQAGADPQVFGATIDITAAQNPQQGLRYIAAQFDIQASDLSGSQVHLAWRLQNSFGNWHNVGFSRHDGLLQATFYPYQNAPNAGHAAITMRLSFGEKVTSQNLQLGMVLLGAPRKSDAQQLAHSGPFAAVVVAKAGSVQPTPTPAPPTPTAQPTTTEPTTDAPTPADSSTPFEAAVPGSTPTNNDASGSAVWVLYMIGGLLLVGGIGVIGTLLWKRTAATNEWLDPNDPSLYGDQNQPYPTQAYPGPAYPSTTYPQPGAYPPPAHGGRPPTDPTRQMPSL